MKKVLIVGGAVSGAVLLYLEEFTFRFNRRRSRHRGLLYYQLSTRPS